MSAGYISKAIGTMTSGTGEESYTQMNSNTKDFLRMGL